MYCLNHDFGSQTSDFTTAPVQSAGHISKTSARIRQMTMARAINPRAG